MKKIVCGCFGTIYYAQILRNGMMSSANRENVTDDAILAVLQHLMTQDDYIKDGHFGYEYSIGNVPVNIIAYDKRKYTLVEKGKANE